MPDLLRHLRALSGEAGPFRYGSVAAREYSHQVWSEPFHTALPERWAWVLLLGISLAGGGSAWSRPDVALAVTLLPAAVVLGRLHLGRLFPWGEGENLISVIPSSEMIRRRLLVVAGWQGAADGGGPPWLTGGLFRRWAAACLVANPILVGAHLLAPHMAWGWALGGCLALAGVSALSLLLWAPNTRRATPGQSNPAGIAVALHLGQLLAEAPLRQTEVWTIITLRADEGLQALADRHGSLLEDAHVIVLECVAAGRVQYHAASGLEDEVAAAHPELGVVRVAAPGVGQADLLEAVGARFGGLSIFKGGRNAPDALRSLTRFLAEMALRADRQAP